MPTDVSIYGQVRQPEPFINQLLAISQQERQETALSAEQLALGLRHLDAVHQAVAAHASDPAATVDTVQRGLGDLVAQRILRPDEARRYASQIEAFRSNPAGFRSYLNTHLNALQDARTNFGATYGTPDVQDLGDNRLTRTVSPSMGVRPLARDAVALTPQDKAARVPTFKNGQPGSEPASALNDRYGYPLRPAPISGPQASAGGAAAPGSMAPSGFVPSGPALGEAAVSEGGATQYRDDLRTAAASGPEIASLRQALGALDTLGAEGTGPGTTGRNRIQSALNAAGLSGLPGIDKAKIASFEEAQAFLDAARRNGQVVPGQGQPAGAGTPTTPQGLDISQPAARALVQAQIAQRRMQAAQARSYEGRDNGAAYGRHAADFSGSIDPRAFAVDTMSASEKQALMRSLGPPGSLAYRKFTDSLRKAHDLRLLDAGQ